MSNNDYDLMQKIITPTCRIAFAKNLFKVNKKGRYSLGVVFEMDAETLKELELLKKLISEHTDNTWPKGAPSNFHTPLKVEDREDMLEKYPFMKDMVVLNASNGFEVPVIDLHGRDLGDGDITSGDYVKLSISAYAYNNENKGVGFNINGVQKIKNGEAFYGRSSAADMFGITPASLETTVDKNEAAKEDDDNSAGFNNFGF